MAGMLDAIGNTPIVELQRIRPRSGARVMVKLESANPTGSMKEGDRDWFCPTSLAA